MPRYFFHVDAGRDSRQDQIGAEIAGDENAKAHAILYARAFGTKKPAHDVNGTITVSRDDGKVVGRVGFLMPASKSY